MNKVTAIVLTRNEETMIADCLDSLKFCDEVVVIDNGSTDRTVELAQLLGAYVYTSNAPDFAERRNYGLRKAKHPWVFYVDADERVSPELATAIKDVLIQKDPAFVAYRVQRKNFYLGNHEWPFVEKLERFFKKKSIEGWFGELHESAKVVGDIGELEGFLLHYTHRDLSSMVEKTITWSGVEAQLRYSSHHPKMTWWRFPRVMLTAFWDSYVTQKGYKAGTVGLIESMYQMFSMFITYARLWEMQNSKSTNTTPDNY